jgi:hypothetical protein
MKTVPSAVALAVIGVRAGMPPRHAGRRVADTAGLRRGYGGYRGGVPAGRMAAARATTAVPPHGYYGGAWRGGYGWGYRPYYITGAGWGWGGWGWAAGAGVLAGIRLVGMARIWGWSAGVRRRGSQRLRWWVLPRCQRWLYRERRELAAARAAWWYWCGRAYYPYVESAEGWQRVEPRVPPSR